MRNGVGVIVALLGLGVPQARAEHRQAGSLPPQARVIVQGRDMPAAEAAVASVGGVVTHRLGIINGVGATLDAVQIDQLRRGPALVSVFPDRAVGLSGVPGQLSDSPRLVGADQLHAANITGSGVTIAFLDTGYAATEGLQTDTANASRIVAGYNAIKDTTDMASVLDGNGHGSHVLSVAVSSDYDTDQFGARYNGIAPDAKVVVVKAFDDNGWGTYSGVIRGIDWVVANKDTHGIRVLNCSFGSPPRSHYWQDPLNQAIMRAWQAGIVVVVSAGNTGPSAQSIRAPGNVPYVITVGAMTDSYTPGLAADDRLASFSSAGPTYDRFVKPDVVAPGGHVLGQMDRKSSLAREHRRFLDRNTNKYFTMSGTSQAAAVVSGSVALLLQQNQQLTPDNVKCRLMSTARGGVNILNQRAYSVFQQGTGQIFVPAATASATVGCANVGLNLTADLAGEQHFSGRARQQPDGGNFYVEGLSSVDGSTWDGQFQTGGANFNGDPWTDVSAGLQGDPWTDTFTWPGGYPWENHLWTAELEESVSVNIWVQQQ